MVFRIVIDIRNKAKARIDLREDIMNSAKKGDKESLRLKLNRIYKSKFT